MVVDQFVSNPVVLLILVHCQFQPFHPMLGFVLCKIENQLTVGFWIDAFSFWSISLHML